MKRKVLVLLATLLALQLLAGCGAPVYNHRPAPPARNEIFWMFDADGYLVPLDNRTLDSLLLEREREKKVTEPGAIVRFLDWLF